MALPGTIIRMTVSFRTGSGMDELYCDFRDRCVLCKAIPPTQMDMGYKLVLFVREILRLRDLGPKTSLSRRPRRSMKVDMVMLEHRECNLNKFYQPLTPVRVTCRETR